MSDPFASAHGRVAIVGSGLAGLMTALELAPLPVVILTKAALGGESSSAWAQGGIAASLSPDDSVELHLADTLKAGDGLCDEAATATILGEGPVAIERLEHYGATFDRKQDGTYALGLEAAHCRRRIVHINGDRTGAGVTDALVAAVRRTPSITVIERCEARRILLSDGEPAGLLCETPQGQFILKTGRIVLATGGVGGLFDAATSPTGNFGQGVALAARAGAVLADMEFVQFHPTALDSPRRPMALVSEALRGEGALLVNEMGERFMADTPGAELAPRDVVARAIGREIARGGHVFLDARQSIGLGFAARFPTIDTLVRDAGINPTTDLIPVRPAVHYHMGGVATTTSGASSIPGLWVVGEAACSGLHGANRLASNSLLEAAVMGMLAARDIAGYPDRDPPVPRPVCHVPSPCCETVRQIASYNLGMMRQGTDLRQAIQDLLPLVDNEGPASDPAIVALLIAVFALLRTESRGAHSRRDFNSSNPVADRRKMLMTDALDIARTVISPTPIARSA